ncbi:DUF5687 family protein [Capnocytophaga cynodegmi]|uniref:DUF5687 family protein n=1 Tax=Capnocytophaga cynodegmi TaxID=28189 RepID=UPI001BB44DCE|nr:DUF5687 family protein [Capnocytophaga cynodegmi]
MFKHFLILEWKAFTRSATFGRSLALKIFIAFIAIYFLSMALFIGITIYPILKEIFPEQEPIHIFNNFITIWFLWELIIRFMFQSLPVMDIKPLLTNNIHRSKIIHYLLLKTILHPFNLFAPLIFIPFGMWVITSNDYSFLTIFCWWIAMFSFVFLANFTNFILIKKFGENLKALLPYAGSIVIFILLEYFEIFSITKFIGQSFNLLLSYPFLVIIPIVLTIGIYILNFNSLSKNLYLDSTFRGKTQKINTSDFQWLKRFGNIATFLQLDLKLIWRNKRSKSVFWTSIIFVFYGLIFYPNPSFENMPFFLVFVGIFTTGVFLINFGQFVPAWDSAYYPMLMAQNISLRQYLNSKAVLFYFSIIVLFIISTPYIYFGKHIFIINTSCAIYNIGIGVPSVLFLGTYNKKRIDLEKRGFGNYQGMGMTQWIISFPILLIPIILWSIVYYFFNDMIASAVIALIGIMGFILRNYFMNIIVKKYKSRKYITINGFKENQ